MANLSFVFWNCLKKFFFKYFWVAVDWFHGCGTHGYGGLTVLSWVTWFFYNFFLFLIFSIWCNILMIPFFTFQTMVSLSFVNIFIMAILKSFFFFPSVVTLPDSFCCLLFFPGVWVIFFCFFAWLILFWWEVVIWDIVLYQIWLLFCTLLLQTCLCDWWPTGLF